MADTFNVMMTCGSLRKDSFNRKLMSLLPGLAPPELKLTEGPPFAGMPIYNFDIQNDQGFPAEVMAYANAIKAADGLIIVSPEYNWTIPGGLKNAIDWLSRLKDQPYANKPIAIQSCAGGLLGGSRMQYHLRQSLTALDAFLYGRPEVLITFAAQKFDDAGNLKDQASIDLIKQQLAGFAKFIKRVRD